MLKLDNTGILKHMSLKKYKFASTSLSLYIIALIWYGTWFFYGSNLIDVSKSNLTLDTLNNSIIAVFLLIVLSGVFFGLKSNKKKESQWVGNLLAALGLACVFYFILLFAGMM